MSESATVAPARGKLGRDTWLAIVAMGLAVFVIANDVTAMSVVMEPGVHFTGRCTMLETGSEGVEYPEYARATR